MNNGYINKNVFPGTPVYQNYQKNIKEQTINLENTSITSILKLNKGNKANIYMSFPYANNSNEFDGIIEDIIDNYIILSNPTSGKWNLLPISYINFITFDEKINYNL